MPGTVTQAQIDALNPGVGWDDGRTGFERCRFDALLDESGLRAEVTWDNDSNLGHTSRPFTYYDPELLLETNVRRGDEWIRQHTVQVRLTQEEARAIVEAAANRVKTTYAREIAMLQTGSIS